MAYQADCLYLSGVAILPVRIVRCPRDDTCASMYQRTIGKQGSNGTSWFWKISYRSIITSFSRIDIFRSFGATHTRSNSCGWKYRRQVLTNSLLTPSWDDAKICRSSSSSIWIWFPSRVLGQSSVMSDTDKESRLWCNEWITTETTSPMGCDRCLKSNLQMHRNDVQTFVEFNWSEL